MKKILLLALFCNQLFGGGPTTTVEFIKIDQFGYKPGDEKVAVSGTAGGRKVCPVYACRLMRTHGSSRTSRGPIPLVCGTLGRHSTR